MCPAAAFAPRAATVCRFILHTLQFSPMNTVTLPTRTRGVLLGALLTCGLAVATSDAHAQAVILDADGDTRVETQPGGGDPDIIRFTVGGTDRLRLRDQRFEFLNNGQSIFIGTDAGRDDDLTTNRNAFIGFQAGLLNKGGSLNTGIGFQALRANQTGNNNAGIGTFALRALTSGGSNTAIAYGAFQNLASGNANTAIGASAGISFTSGSGNTFLGQGAGSNKSTGDFNTLIGSGAGSSSGGGSNNVFIGYTAGRNETGSDKLYIANSAASFPLIKGDFDAEELAINGEVGIGTEAPNAQLHVKDPSATGNNEVLRMEGSNPFLSFYSPGGGLRSYIWQNNANKDLDIINTVSDGEVNIDNALRVKSNGRVGIGATTPEAELEILHNSTVAVPHLKLNETGAGDFARLELASGAGTDVWQIAGRTNATDDELNFFYDGGTAKNIMSLEGSSGEVGIGTTDPKAALHVRDVESASLNELLRLEGNSPYLTFYEGSDYLAYLYHTGPGNDLALYNLEAGDIILNRDVRPASNGTQDLGLPSTKWRNLYLDGSVLFAAAPGGTSIALDATTTKTVGKGESGRGAGVAYGLEHVLKLRPTAHAVDGATKLSFDPASFRGNVDALYAVEHVEASEEKSPEGEVLSRTEEHDEEFINVIDLIPVLVSAIQEQNAEVAELREENAEMLEELDHLAALREGSAALETMLADIERTKAELEQMRRDLSACCLSAEGPGTAATAAPVATFGDFQPTDAPLLEQNAPNPFSEETRIRYYLPAGATGEIVVTDVTGREVRRERALPGANALTLQARSLAAGVYQYTLVIDGAVVQTKQMSLTH